MVVFAGGDVLKLDELPSELFFASQPGTQPAGEKPVAREPRPCESERLRFQEAFKSCRGNKSALARMLSTSRSQVDRLLTRFGHSP